jgi:hypothetical protein
VNPCGKSDRFDPILNFAKMADQSEAKSAEPSFASKKKVFFFVAYALSIVWLKFCA